MIFWDGKKERMELVLVYQIYCKNVNILNSQGTIKCTWFSRIVGTRNGSLLESILEQNWQLGLKCVY